MERKELRADEAKGVWDYSINHQDQLFKQRINRPIGSEDFYTYIYHISQEEVGGWSMEVIRAVSEMDEGPYAAISQAIERGDEIIRRWKMSKEDPITR